MLISDEMEIASEQKYYGNKQQLLKKIVLKLLPIGELDILQLVVNADKQLTSTKLFYFKLILTKFSINF